MKRFENSYTSLICATDLVGDPQELASAVSQFDELLKGFTFTHRRLYPDESRQRINKTILIGISPLSTIRATDQLAKDLLRKFHPIAACYYLCSQVDFERQARIAHNDEQNRAAGNLSDVASVKATQFEACSDTNISMFLNSIGCLKQILKPPVPDDSFSSSYCPRCHCQYRSGFQICADCDNVKLSPLDS